MGLDFGLQEPCATADTSRPTNVGGIGDFPIAGLCVGSCPIGAWSRSWLVLAGSSESRQAAMRAEGLEFISSMVLDVAVFIGALLFWGLYQGP